MALNPNHIFEDIDGVKCSIVEKECSKERNEFLKKLLEHNGFTVIVKLKPPKAPPKPAADEPAVIVPLTVPDLFTVGVTDVAFNPVKAIYRRELLTPDGHIVTPKYWRQEETVSHDETWYWIKN